MHLWYTDRVDPQQGEEGTAMLAQSKDRTVRIAIKPETLAVAKVLATLEGNGATYRTVLARAATVAVETQMATIHGFLRGIDSEQVPASDVAPF